MKNKKKRKINFKKITKQTKKVVFGNPNEKVEIGRTRTLFLVVVLIYILSMIVTYLI